MDPTAPLTVKRFALAIGLIALAVITGCERTDSVQRGFRGTGMVMVYDKSDLRTGHVIHEVPEPEPVDPPDPEAPPLKSIYKNVQVLGDLSVLDFSRLMAAMSTWVAPEEGCNFCHNPKNLASDEKYTKVVARRMIQMTRALNNNWKTHVADTGVTCWTCHRGQAVPSGEFFSEPARKMPGLMGTKNNENQAGKPTVGFSSLPNDPLSRFLIHGEENIRVQSTQALPGTNDTSIKLAEHTYGLMMYFSSSLGVNCNYCHNTRAMRSWEESPPQRSTAWYGIRMVRNLNTEYVLPIGPLLPAHRWSAQGDYPKVACMTCHKGAYKPMYGSSMKEDYPELWKPDYTKGGPTKVFIPEPKPPAVQKTALAR
jgi:photosynthetic reaction center cytochrome c subunit